MGKRRPTDDSPPTGPNRYRRTEPGEFADDVIEDLLQALSEGKSMRSICADRRMPDRETVRRWSERDDDLAAKIARAREVGYHERAERAVEAAQMAEDAALGRLAFDAERWYLGKLSRGFADKPIQVEATTTLKADPDDAFGKLAGALERAASAIASGARGTIEVADDRPA